MYPLEDIQSIGIVGEYYEIYTCENILLVRYYIGDVRKIIIHLHDKQEIYYESK